MRKGMIAVLAAAAGVLTGAVAGAEIATKRLEDESNKRKKMSDKHLALFLMMNQWVKVKQEGKSIDSYLKAHNYKTIAIYGMSYAGETLFEELRNSDIEVAYGIDKNEDVVSRDVELVTPEDELQSVDAIVVTPIFFFDSIKEMLEKKTGADILSLEEILYEM